jgi:hypothetical protein
MARFLGMFGVISTMVMLLTDPRKMVSYFHSKTDTRTIVNKHLVGYQGWFECPTDGFNHSAHWITPQGPVFDYWPDVSEFARQDLCILDSYKDRNGELARVYSAHNANVVGRHFEWIKNYNIDGVFLQNFFSDMRDELGILRRLHVTSTVAAAAERNDRVWSIMFDISDLQDDLAFSQFVKIWPRFKPLVEKSKTYLYENGKPVVAIWGLGFGDSQHPISPSSANRIVDYLKRNQGLYIVGGVPWNWRIQGLDTWISVYERLDALNPWNVGSFGKQDMDKLYTIAAQDKQWLDARNIFYICNVFPGFSWYNLQQGQSPLNKIPRDGGEFYFNMVKTILRVKPHVLYTAMFDEVNEGTAIFKLVAKKSDLPQPGTWNYLDIDGVSLPNDWYLELAGLFTLAMRQKRDLEQIQFSNLLKP